MTKKFCSPDDVSPLSTGVREPNNFQWVQLAVISVVNFSFQHRILLTDVIQRCIFAGLLTFWLLSKVPLIFPEFAGCKSKPSVGKDVHSLIQSTATQFLNSSSRNAPLRGWYTTRFWRITLTESPGINFSPTHHSHFYVWVQ